MKRALFEIMTNEWYDVRRTPPAGRFVLCVVEKELRSGNVEQELTVAAWNGFYWINQQHKRIEEKTVHIVAWYMYEKYNRNSIVYD